MGAGVGEKFTDGRPTGELAIKVYVREKLREDRVASRFVVPKQVKGFPTDIEAVGRLLPFMNAGRYRPEPGGVSAGLAEEVVGFRYAGTHGCLVQWGESEGLYGLSNNHVYADENRAPIGSAILQPGTLDGGDMGDKVATLAHFAKLKFGPGEANTVDAALAQADDPKLFVQEVLALGPVNGSMEPARRIAVVKNGRTTQLTEGVVRDVDADIKVEYDTGVALFTDQVRITGVGRPAFSRAGDSGSVILDAKTNAAVGLLFAGSETHDETFANKPSHLKEELNITFPAAGAPGEPSQRPPRKRGSR